MVQGMHWTSWSWEIVANTLTSEFHLIQTLIKEREYHHGGLQPGLDRWPRRPEFWTIRPVRSLIKVLTYISGTSCLV